MTPNSKVKRGGRHIFQEKYGLVPPGVGIQSHPRSLQEDISVWRYPHAKAGYPGGVQGRCFPGHLHAIPPTSKGVGASSTRLGTLWCWCCRRVATFPSHHPPHNSAMHMVVIPYSRASPWHQPHNLTHAQSCAKGPRSYSPLGPLPGY